MNRLDLCAFATKKGLPEQTQYLFNEKSRKSDMSLLWFAEKIIFRGSN
jgi:hypothetical protein